MNVQLDESEVRQLIEQMVDWGGDESGYYHLVGYVMEQLYDQYPELKALADERFK